MSDVMMWVFAVLIVLAMGGVVMLAVGLGEPMTPAYDDRPDALVPADRRIGAEDLRRVRFSLAFRGYRMSEVDALLSRMAAEMETPDKPRTPGYWGQTARPEPEATNAPAPAEDPPTS